MGFGFLFAGAVREKIKERLRKDGNGIFSDSDLELASKRFEEAGEGKDLDALRNESSQKEKAVEIFKRIEPRNSTEQELMAKIKGIYGIA